VIGVLGTVPRRLPKYLRMIGVGMSMEMFQKTVFFFFEIDKDLKKDHRTEEIALGYLRTLAVAWDTVQITGHNWGRGKLF